MIDKVYILQGWCGDLAYTSAYTVGIYTTAELADDAKRKFIAELTELKSRYTEDDIERLLKDGETFDWSNDVASKELEDFNHWYFKMQPEQYSIESISVVEQLLNEKIFKFTDDAK